MTGRFALVLRRLGRLLALPHGLTGLLGGPETLRQASAALTDPEPRRTP